MKVKDLIAGMEGRALDTQFQKDTAVCPDCPGTCGNAGNGIKIWIAVGDYGICDPVGDFYEVHGP